MNTPPTESLALIENFIQNAETTAALQPDAPLIVALRDLVEQVRKTEAMLGAATRVQFETRGELMVEIWRSVRHGELGEWTLALDDKYSSHPDALSAYQFLKTTAEKED